MARSRSMDRKKRRSNSHDSSRKRKKYDDDYKKKRKKHTRKHTSSSSSKDYERKKYKSKNTRKERSHRKRDRDSVSPKVLKSKSRSSRYDDYRKSSKSRRRERSPSRTPHIDPAEIERRKREEETKKKFEQEVEKKKLLEVSEEERNKRRERVLAWQEQFKHPNQANGELDIQGNNWTFEDDKDDEEIIAPPHGDKNDEDKKPKESFEPEDDIDPLDVYMAELKSSIIPSKPTVVSDDEAYEDETKPLVIETVVVPSDKIAEHDGEILEQFGDAAEYSSEEEDEGISSNLPLTKKNTKILPPVDHSKIYYREFRKNFYIETAELSKMTDAEVAAYRKELENIQVKGKGCPKPVKRWVQLGVSTIMLEVLKKQNYLKPTPIQAQAIPAIMAGRDLIGIAKTGSGKTLAFLLPLFRHVLDQPELEDGDGPISIIMTPTRELAIQIYRECKRFCRYLSLTVVCVYGGCVVSEQIADLKRGTEIIVCTPGRMIDMLSANNGRVTNCRRCTYLVLDEADRMFDMGFEPQVSKIIEQIRPDRQIVLFTATFPTSMEGLARKLLAKPIEVVVGVKNKVCDDVKQHLLYIESDNRFLKLLELLGIYYDKGQVLIFVERQESAGDLLKDLLTKGYPCLTLHGGMDQYDRDSTIADFKNEVCDILIATSVASRGIDIKNVVLVVNYDCPNHREDYVHRCGRTGRAGKKGTAITFITARDGKYLRDILATVEKTNCEISPQIMDVYKKYMSNERNRYSKTYGFSGKGFKFNNEELALAYESKKMIKWTFGWQDSGDEAEAEEKTLKKIEHEIDRACGSRPRRSMGQAGPVDKGKMELAQSIANRLNEKLKPLEGISEANKKVINISQPTKSDNQPVSKSLELAKSIAGKLNMKINEEAVTSAPRQETIKKLADCEVYYEEIDINDFPQLARQTLTSKEVLDSIADTSDCAVTVRGTFSPSGRPLEFIDRRLHLLIEGKTEFKVQIAKSEVKRILKEECLKSDVVFMQPSGRFKIT